MTRYINMPRSDDPPHRGETKLSFKRLLSATLFVLALIAVAGFVILPFYNAGLSAGVSANVTSTTNAGGGTQHDVLPSQSGTEASQVQSSDDIILPPAQDSNTQFQLAGSDQYLVWTEGVTKQDGYGSKEGTLDIEAVDLKTRRTFPVTDAPGNQFAPAIEGSTVVWIDTGGHAEAKAAGGYSIRGKNLADGKTFTVVTGATALDNLSIAGNKVAWIQADETTRRIMLKDLRGGPPATIYAVPREVTSALLEPRLSADYVVWKDKVPTSSPYAYDLRAFDLRTASVKTLVQRTSPKSLPLSDLRFDVWGHYLVWQSPYLDFLDMDTGEQATLDPKYIQAVAIQGEIVVWTVTDVTGTQLRGLKLTDRTTLIIEGPGKYYSPTIAGSWVAWTAYAERTHILTANLDSLFSKAVTPVATVPLPPPTGLLATPEAATPGPDLSATLFAKQQP